MLRFAALAVLLTGAFWASGVAVTTPDGLPGGGPDGFHSTDHACGAFPVPDPVLDLEHVVSVPGLVTARGIMTSGHRLYAIAPSLGPPEDRGLFVVDVCDPEQPRVVGRLADKDGRPFGGSDVVVFKDDVGRMVAAVARGADGLAFIDVTDPANPIPLAEILGGTAPFGGPTIEPDGAKVHNLAVVPGTAIVYNSREVDKPGVDIIDASDAADPKVVHVAQPTPGVTCHDVTFNTEGDRAYCAAIKETQIWNTSDPTNPRLISTVVNPLVNIHHWARVTEDGETLIIGDEFAGAKGPLSGCVAHDPDSLGLGPVSDPVGAIWFYDISVETAPVPLSWMAPDPPVQEDQTPCTAHFGDLVPGRDLLVVGWYRAGTQVVDVTDVGQPRIVTSWGGDEGANTWEARVVAGFVVTGDVERGVDILAFGG